MNEDKSRREATELHYTADGFEYYDEFKRGKFIERLCHGCFFNKGFDYIPEGRETYHVLKDTWVNAESDMPIRYVEAAVTYADEHENEQKLEAAQALNFKPAEKPECQKELEEFLTVESLVCMLQDVMRPLYERMNKMGETVDSIEAKAEKLEGALEDIKTSLDTLSAAYQALVASVQNGQVDQAKLDALGAEIDKAQGVADSIKSEEDTDNGPAAPAAA